MATAPFVHFNPRAPRGARRHGTDGRRRNNVFQSTCPARGTTGGEASHVLTENISIHVPREGHDRASACVPSRDARFQSTCPARGTTSLHRAVHKHGGFQSTCPARGTTLPSGSRLSSPKFQSTCPARGTTAPFVGIKSMRLNFNPRAPRGARQIVFHRGTPGAEFQSTCPARGTTRLFLSYLTS